MTMTAGRAVSNSDEPQSPSAASGPLSAAEVLRSFVQGLRWDQSQVAYVSTPITTGLEFYAHVPKELLTGGHEQNPEVAAARAHAMARNAVVAEETVEKARAAGLASVVINPTDLVVRGWDQVQYLDFWLEFIRSSVGTLVLAPGWQYSTGSVAECDLAFRLGLPVRDSELELRTRTWAAELINGALSDFRLWKLSPPPTHVEAVRALMSTPHAAK
jgi:hypothetical protein